MENAARIVAVVVTWNRRALLAESLEALRRQTTAPAAVVVVDNASDDGTAALLRDRFAEVDVVTTARNGGGAGGFAVGIDRALRSHPDALWLMDDDTVPTDTALAELVDAWKGSGDPRAAVVASKVVWTDGREHPMNTPRRKPGVRRAEIRAAQALGCTPVRSASFVSVLLDADAVRERGLPVADYFLWNDDFEYTTRLIRGRRGLHCPASVVVHKTAAFGSTDTDPGERFFYEVRNKVWLLTRSRSLTPAEKVLYGGSTGRRWWRTVVRSADRRTLLRCLRRGMLAGLRAGPAPTDAVVAELTTREHRRG